MSPRELEDHFAAALLGGPEEAIVAAIEGDGLDPAARLAIYRHHIFATLTEALETTYPVVVRLVDRRFFAYAADRFIRRYPPAGPCLFEYGEQLPDFLAAFPACRHLGYLPDVARLEWAIGRALHAEDAVPLDPRWLTALPAEEIGRLSLRLHPSLSLIRSPWPVDRIWKANRQDAEPDTKVDLDDGGVALEIFRRDDDVAFRRVVPGSFAFRIVLASGGDLRTAVETARAADPAFDPTEALRDLLDDGLIVGARSAARPADGSARCVVTRPAW